MEIRDRFGRQYAPGQFVLWPINGNIRECVVKKVSDDIVTVAFLDRYGAEASEWIRRPENSVIVSSFVIPETISNEKLFSLAEKYKLL